MSDHESLAAFRANPLFQEVYRHLESRHQIAFHAARLHDSQIILSRNRPARNFTTRESQLLHLLELQVAVLSRRIEDNGALLLKVYSRVRQSHELEIAKRVRFI